MDEQQIRQLHEEAAKTDLVFDGTPNEREYRSFLLYNNYTSWTGILSVVFGIVCIGILVKYWDQAATVNRYALAVLALLFLTGMPLYNVFQAKWRAHDRLAKKIRYTFLIEGVKSDVGEEDSYFVKWRKILKVRETSQDILLYLDNTKAMIVPKRPLGDRVDDVKGLIDRHMVNHKRVKWKKF